MKACDLDDKTYKELTRLPYARKINYTDEAPTFNVSSMSKKAQEALRNFPIKPIVEENLMWMEDLDGEQQFYLLTEGANTFLVDTQGYNYPRYILKLKFENVMETA